MRSEDLELEIERRLDRADFDQAATTGDSTDVLPSNNWRKTTPRSALPGQQGMLAADGHRVGEANRALQHSQRRGDQQPGDRNKTRWCEAADRQMLSTSVYAGQSLHSDAIRRIVAPLRPAVCIRVYDPRRDP